MRKRHQWATRIEFSAHNKSVVYSIMLTAYGILSHTHTQAQYAHKSRVCQTHQRNRQHKPYVGLSYCCRQVLGIGVPSIICASWVRNAMLLFTCIVIEDTSRKEPNRSKQHKKISLFESLISAIIRYQRTMHSALLHCGSYRLALPPFRINVISLGSCFSHSRSFAYM